LNAKQSENFCIEQSVSGKLPEKNRNIKARKKQEFNESFERSPAARNFRWKRASENFFPASRASGF